ncbi:transcriptional regulator [Leucobacter chinensis]|uniref:transcriptional regulator n=1 Tax=Leucobacter chinensis TaxID=2851010 RepID=UPI001C23409A|nr:transcriptional regulator [Leucobacter chinensis]
MSHPRLRLDGLLNHPLRLSIMAAVANTDRIEFMALAEDLDVTAPTLSKANAVLEGAGYLRIHKGYIGKRPRTWLSLTHDGRQSYEVHLQALREIANAL